MTRQSPSQRAAQATQAHLAQFSDEDLAYHESGHAVVHHLNGGVVRRLSIDRDDPHRGCRLDPRPSPAASDDPRVSLGSVMAALVGGEVAATLHGTPEPLATAGARVDHDAALRAAADAGMGVDEARAMIDAEWNRVRDRLSDPETWRLVESLARALLAQKTLEAGQIAALLAP